MQTQTITLFLCSSLALGGCAVGMAMRGEKRYLAVTYDANDRVTRYRSGSHRT